MSKRQRLVVGAVFLWGLSFLTTDVWAYGSQTVLSYNGQLFGFSTTWKESSDDDVVYSDCTNWIWDPEWEEWYCESYLMYENYTLTRAWLYGPNGLYASGSAEDRWQSGVNVNPFTPDGPGTWELDGNHYRKEYTYQDSGYGWQLIYVTEYLQAQTAYILTITCGDADLDALIAEYRNYNIQPRPTCPDFKNFPPTALVSRYFHWGEVNHPEDNPHNWAIMSGRTLNGLDQTQDIYGDGLRITSGYRSPNVTNGGSFFHLWGRAADQKAWWWPGGIIDHDTWQVLYDAAVAAGPEWVEPYLYNPCNCPSDSRTHVHSQWPYGY